MGTFVEHSLNNFRIIMLKILSGVVLVVTANATTLKLSWSDCGDGAHAKITSFTPDTLKTGEKTTMTGTGTLDEDVSSAKFDLEMKTAVKTISCQGDASQSKTCNLPLGTGSITFEPIAFPVKKGSMPVSVSISLSSLLPSMLAKTETTVKATGPNNEQLFCMDIKTAPALEDDPNGIACDLCKGAVGKGIEAGVTECDNLCKKTGPLDEVCEQACGMIESKCDGSMDCAEKVCGLVKLCGPEDGVNATVVV